MPHLDEGTIHAWLEGGLSPSEAALTEEHIAGCDECSAAVAEARGLIAASSRILTALDNVPSGVIPMRAPRPRPWYMRREFQAAAAVLIVAGGTLVVMRGGERGIASKSAVAVSSAVMDTGGAVPQEAPMAAASSAPRVSQEGQQKKSEVAATTAPTAGRRQLQKLSDKNEVRDEPKSIAADAATAQSAIAGNVAGFARISRADSATRPALVDLMAEPRVVKVERHIGYQPWITYEVAPGVQVTLVRQDSRQLEEVVVTGVATAPEKRTLDAAVRQKAARERAKEAAPVTRDTATRAGAVSEVAIAPVPPASSAPSAPAPLRAAAPAGAALRLTPAAPLDSIQWNDPKTGALFKLIGPLTREQLEVVKKRLPELKQ